jgi:small nuclear ribonucleoprotein (snRNP)-like protein
MNLVLADTEEFRRVKRKPTKAQTAPGQQAPALVESEEKRTLGLTIVRGTHIVSTSVDGPPPSDPAARLGTSAPGGAGGAPATMAAGTGISRPAGRGSLPSGLTGPAAGVGGPGFPGQFPPAGFPGAPPGGFPGRGGPPGGPRKSILFESQSLHRLTNCSWLCSSAGLPRRSPRRSSRWSPTTGRLPTSTGLSTTRGSRELPGLRWQIVVPFLTEHEIAVCKECLSIFLALLQNAIPPLPTFVWQVDLS